MAKQSRRKFHVGRVRGLLAHEDHAASQLQKAGSSALSPTRQGEETASSKQRYSHSTMVKKEKFSQDELDEMAGRYASSRKQRKHDEQNQAS